VTGTCIEMKKLKAKDLFTHNSPLLPAKTRTQTWAYCIEATWNEESTAGDLTKTRVFKYRVPRGMPWEEAVEDAREYLEGTYPFRNYVYLQRYELDR